MSINVIQAAKASSPYPWVKFWKWAMANSYSPDEIQTIIENGIEPNTRIWTSGDKPVEILSKLDETVDYPGLPDPDHLVEDIYGFEPTTKRIGGIA